MLIYSWKNKQLHTWALAKAYRVAMQIVNNISPDREQNLIINPFPHRPFLFLSPFLSTLLVPLKEICFSFWPLCFACAESFIPISSVLYPVSIYGTAQQWNPCGNEWINRIACELCTLRSHLTTLMHVRVYIQCDVPLQESLMQLTVWR